VFTYVFEVNTCFLWLFVVRVLGLFKGMHSTPCLEMVKLNPTSHKQKWIKNEWIKRHSIKEVMTCNSLKLTVRHPYLSFCSLL